MMKLPAIAVSGVYDEKQDLFEKLGCRAGIFSPCRAQGARCRRVRSCGARAGASFIKQARRLQHDAAADSKAADGGIYTQDWHCGTVSEARKQSSGPTI